MNNTENRRCVAADSQNEHVELLYQLQKVDIIGQLAGGMSHDFNNHLTGIMGFANLIHMRSGDDNIKRYADEITNICKKTGDMVKSFLTFARYKPAATVSIDVNQTIIMITELLSNSIGKRIAIAHDLCSRPCIITADAALLQSALLNLALNSKSRVPESGTITFTTSHTDNNSGKFIKIEIIDTGRSIVTEHGFEPFFSAKLPAVYKFVQTMNGTMEANNAAEGKGVSIAIILPRR